MIKCTGKSVLKGIAIGKIQIFKKQEYTLRKEKVADVSAEIKRFEDAKETAAEQLDALYQAALEEVGEEQAMIFEVHKMMLDDGDYLETIMDMIKNENINAEYAVDQVGTQFAELFASMDDEYMKARSADVLDISKRVVQILAGIEEAHMKSEEPVIVLADDLSPSETIQMDKSKVLAFVTREGSTNSHTAILARSMNIPALVKTEIKVREEYNGMMAVVDGFSGEMIVDPSEEILADMQRKKAEHEEHRAQLRKMVGQPSVTTTGVKINVYANAGNVEDIEKVLESDAEGIGLFRSEFLYLGRTDYPTEEEQFTVYQKVVQAMQGKKVIIRTLDIGADKQVDYFNLPSEENPAMGYRAIRICLDRIDIFKTQLRAIYRASAFGTVSIMFPMIISVKEIKRIKEIVEEVKCELSAENIAFSEVELGIMIETPAAVMISDQLAAEVEFFSIGTNDLTQYTLAIDRQNASLDDIYEPHHDAILRMIEMVITNAHEKNVWVGICGELASDMNLTSKFVKMGIDELSVSPTYVLELRKTICEI